jgi:hypothetical protein
MTSNFFFVRILLWSSFGLAAFSACKTTNRANRGHVKVTHGSESQEPSSIVLFRGGHLCTATIVAPDVLLTAAHCAVSENLADYAAFQNFPKFGPGPVAYEIKDRFIHPNYKAGIADPTVDLALLRTDKPFDIEPKKLQMEAPKPGDVINLTGYGETIAGDQRSNPDAKQYSASTILPLEIEIKTINNEVHYVDKSGLDTYTQDDLVNWYLFSDNLQKGILEFCGNAGSAQDTKFKCKGASIASGDSGSAVFQNDKIIAITSTVSVLPDRVWSSATLVSHPGGQKFFCAALARGFVLSWAHVDNSTARLACP